MTKQEATSIATELFKTYPLVQEFHITTDSQAFERRHDAENHAKSFQLPANQVVIKVSREEGAGDATAIVTNQQVVSMPIGTIVKMDTGGINEGQSDYTLKAEDLDKNPSLAQQGLKEGDIIKVPAQEITRTGADVTNPDTSYKPPVGDEQLMIIEKAKEKLAEATKTLANRQQAYNDAEANMRGAAKVAVNRAQADLEDATTELAAEQAKLK